MKIASISILISAAVMISGCSLNDRSDDLDPKEASAVLLQVAQNQERHYLNHDTFTSDLTKLGFPTDPYMTESGLYIVTVTSADHQNFEAKAKFLGDADETYKCLELSITGSGSKHSAPRADCW